jgi:hypothetical protein
MPLSNEQIQEIIKGRRNQKEVQQGKKHQERLRFHTETVLQKSDLSPYYTEFLNWIGEKTPEILSKDKFARFKHLIKAPIQTNELTETIFSRLHRVFHSQDSYFNYTFAGDELEGDWEQYRDAKFWPTLGFEAMQTAIDSVWVVELPSMQDDEYPEPKNKLIDIENVIDIKNDQYNNCIYVIFQLGDYIYVYDDEQFRVYPVINGVPSSIPNIEQPHDLGYTPARMMWSEKLCSNNLINKESPITKELTDLDWLLFHMTSKRYMDLANAYPVTITYELNDDYQDDSITENEQRQVGDHPAGSDLMGSGSLLEVKQPYDNQGHDPMQYGPIKVIAPEVDALDWHVKEEVRLTDKIFRSVVGTDTEVMNDAAKNEKQIDAAFESQSSVLMRVKKNFEIIHKFADSTICRLRYGERFLDCDIDYGTNFFLKDVDDLQEELTKAKESGAPDAILESINNNILHTKYRDDNRSVTRANIITDLDPLPNRSLKEATELFKAGGIDKINFIIKSNLISFVRRFERENVDIVKFGSLTNYNRKVQQIFEALKSYANEMIQNGKDEISQQEAPGDPGRVLS